MLAVSFRLDDMRRWRTTKHENRVQRACSVEAGQSVLQATLDGGCLRSGIGCVDTDPVG
jgi:hypothetical protein